MTVESQPPSLSQDALAAHALLSELRTRIAVQHLPYQHGVEARALESLYEIFGLARKAMKDHPGCSDFARQTTRMLNVDLRPVTAKWHHAQKAGLLESRDGADAFRADLQDVRRKLREFSLTLQEMAYGTRLPDDDTPPAIAESDIDQLFKPVRFGVGNMAAQPNAAEKINSAEAAEIQKRRTVSAPGTEEGFNAIGLALSGGGIRSATFCVGVLQVLAGKGLLGQIDYLSTVSGGGYTGSFVTSWVGTSGTFAPLAKPHGPDTNEFRHVRQHAKYLSATDLKARWTMLVGVLAGMLLNWTAPLFLIALCALAAAAAGGAMLATLKAGAGAFALITCVILIVYGIFLRNGTQSQALIAALAGSAGIGLFLIILLMIEQTYSWLSDPQRSLSVLSIASLMVVLPAIARILPTFRSLKARKIAVEALLWSAGVAVPILALACFYLLRYVASHGTSECGYLIDGWPFVALIVVATGLFAIFALNINATGPYKLYRDALARTFLSPNQTEEALTSVNPSGLAPYHLINATVNLPSSTSPVLKDRKGDFFVFSKSWTGSVATGYHETANWKVGADDVRLATAMAVSGAAASPHMGLGSKPTLTALMTLLNLRLGLWVRHPKRVGETRPGFLCLMREMTGVGMAEDSAWLNLTDGGHMENLGVYELLRRRCKFIICVDGEADPNLTFEGGLTLVRHAQIDFGIRIEPRLDDMRLNANGFSRRHSQLFKIKYPDEGAARPAAVGLLLYLKLSLTGNEAELLKRYRMLNPDFPHQSTADQFYDEEQFEAYRQLGVHVADGVFSPALLTTNSHPATVAEWFRQLAENMLEPSTI